MTGHARDPHGGLVARYQPDSLAHLLAPIPGAELLRPSISELTSAATLPTEASVASPDRLDDEGGDALGFLVGDEETGAGNGEQADVGARLECSPFVVG